MAEGAGLVASAVVAVISDQRDVLELFGTGSVTIVGGLLLWWNTKPSKQPSRRATFRAVTWTWIVVCAFGAVPFALAHAVTGVGDAVFESVSGFTATGSTVLAPIEGVSDGLLFWRSLTQWYGGLGMIVLAVAALPFLGVGGQQLLSAEAPGPMPDHLAPRIATTALRLWIIYVTITGVTAIALMVAGTDLYDGVTHAFTAVSTGGFSRYDRSVAHFDSFPIELILDLAMLAGATNFALHWRASRGERGVYRASSEFRLFLAVVAGAIAVIVALNVAHGATLVPAAREASFNVISVITTTGFGLGDYVRWVPAAQLILLLLMMSGSMSGSTSGAIKLFRIQVVLRYARREITHIRHPRAALVVRHDGSAVPEEILRSIIGFFLFYVVLVIVGTVTVAMFGSDLATAAGGAVTAIGGVGPGLADAGPTQNFLAFEPGARLVLAALMLIGRLEIYPVLIGLAAGSFQIRRAAEGRVLVRR